MDTGLIEEDVLALIDLGRMDLVEIESVNRLHLYFPDRAALENQIPKAGLGGWAAHLQPPPVSLRQPVRQPCGHRRW